MTVITNIRFAIVGYLQWVAGLFLPSGYCPECRIKLVKMESPVSGHRGTYTHGCPECGYFYGLANALSPENLAGDGEYSRAQIIVRKKRLLAEWRKLEKEVGFKVSISDAENYNPRAKA